jgi:cobalamin biosynthesis protein CobC
MLTHGGNLNEAVLRFNRPRHDWLDLSAGLNPQHYPVPPLAAELWHRLPESDPALALAAADYYRAPLMLPVAGTQAAIQALPRLRAALHGPARVVAAAPSYAEHAHHWAQHGHQMREVPYAGLEEAVDHCDVLVVCNPNNPTGALVAARQLLEWAERLAARGGWLVVDEAFGDMLPKACVAPYSDRPGLIVLRSVGKFFGLAGLRLGFVAAEAGLLAALADLLGPWTVSGPAQQIGGAALRDLPWQRAMRENLLQQGARLQRLLAEYGIASSGTALFQWWPEPQAEACWQHMAERGIWVRLFTEKTRGIRLGLPPDEAGWQRLSRALDEWNKGNKQ